jgi:hypothetical protein
MYQRCPVVRGEVRGRKTKIKIKITNHCNVTQLLNENSERGEDRELKLGCTREKGKAARLRRKKDH